MRTRYAIFLVFSLATFIWVCSASSKATITSKNKALYEAYIDEVVSKCEPKIARFNSGSKNIRQESALYSLKAAFCSYRKAELVKEMMIVDIGVKKHQMHYYLNKRFFHTLRTAAKNLDS